MLAACCRSIFDMDGIDLGPERRQYLDHQLSRVWECNGQGSIPYVPRLRAPYYVWIGHVPQLATVLSENKVSAVQRKPTAFLQAPRLLSSLTGWQYATLALHPDKLDAITVI